MQKIKKFLMDIGQKRLCFKEMILFYSIIGVFLIGSMIQLNHMGYTPTILLVQNVMPHVQVESMEKKLFYHWMNFMTGIKWDEPSSFIIDLTPWRKQIYVERVASGEVKGYFDQDENSYLAEDEESQMYNPQIPSKSQEQDYTAFQDVAYVYKNYMTAPGKMEFGLDMLDKWNFYELVTQPIELKEQMQGPQILIFHTHSREAFIGGLTVVDIAEALKERLETAYGISVLHVTDAFYEENNEGSWPTGGEYERMEPVIRDILEQNPSISVVIDLHRDGVNEGVHLVTDINGKQTARIMFVNGLCLNRNMAGEVEEKEGLSNPYIGDNLAFSLQTMVQMNQQYPGLSRKIYLNEWRYSTHMKPYSLLMEWGAQTNTSEEAMNAVEPVAEILAKVLQKD